MSKSTTVTMDDLLAGNEVKQLEAGDVIEGVVSSVKKHEVWIDLCYILSDQAKRTQRKERQLNPLATWGPMAFGEVGVLGNCQGSEDPGRNKSDGLNETFDQPWRSHVLRRPTRLPLQAGQLGEARGQVRWPN